MKNVSNDIKIPAIIALVLQGAAVSAQLLVVLLQRQLVPLFYAYGDLGKDIWVFPPSVILEIMILVLYIVFVYLIFSNKDMRRRPVCIVLIAINLGIMGMSYPVSYVFTVITARLYGTMQMAVASSVQNMFAIVNAFFGFASSPLFFIACGRYGVSKNS